MPHATSLFKSNPNLLTFKTIAIDVAKNGTRTLVAAPGAGYAIWMYGIAGSAVADGTFKLQDEDGTALTGTISVLASQLCGFVSANLDLPWVKVAENKALEIVLSADADFDGVLIYAEVPV